MKKSVKELILEYLKDKDWEWGGRIEDYIRRIYGAKASNCSRRLRELQNEGQIQVKYEKVNGKGAKVTLYCLTKLQNKMF